MPNVNAQLAGASLQVIDQSGNVQRVNSPIATLVAQTNAAFYEPYFQIGVGSTSLTLPATTVWVVYIKNLSGAATINVTCTPAGGSAWASPLVLVPTQVFMYFATFSSNPASGGVTAISVQASAGSTPAEILLAA